MNALPRGLAGFLPSLWESRRILNPRHRAIECISREVTLDREIDAVALGFKEGSVFVGIVAGPFVRTPKYWILEFATNAQSQDGLCGSKQDARLQLEKLSIPEDAPKGCDQAEVARECRRWRQTAQLVYLAAARGSKGINLGDGKCDSFHIYFDPVRRQPTWSRL